MTAAYLFVENFDREFRGKFHLAIEMINKGVCDTIFLGDQRDFFILSMAGLINDSIVLIKSCQPYIYDRLIRLKKGLNVICMQDEEGLVRIELPGNNINSRNDPKIISFIDRVFCWNISEQISLLSTSAGVQDKLIITGNVRTCAYVDNKKLYADQINEIQKVTKRFILITGNGKIAFGRYHGESLKCTLDRSLKLNNRDDLYAQAVYEWSHNTTASYLEIFSFVNKFRKEFGSEIDVVYRPHPGEDPRLVKIILENLGVIVDTRFSVIPWILNCECVVGSGSTTLLEATVLGKPSFSVVADTGRPDSEFIKNMQSHIYSVICQDANDLYFKVCDLIKNQNYPSSLFEDAKYYAQSDVDTTSAIAGEMSKLIQKNKVNQARYINSIALKAITLKAYRLFVQLFSKRQAEQIHTQKYSNNNLTNDIRHLRAYASNNHVSMKMLDKRILILKKS